MSQFFASGGQSTGTSASASVLPMNIQPHPEDFNPVSVQIIGASASASVLPMNIQD